MNSIFYAFIFTLYDEHEYKLIYTPIGKFYIFQLLQKEKGRKDSDIVIEFLYLFNLIFTFVRLSNWNGKKFSFIIFCT